MKKYTGILAIFVATIISFYPIFLGKIPLNGHNLVSFFSPWIYEKWSGYPAGVPAKPGILDQLRIYYPYMRLTQESYRLGQLPLWNPYNFAGNPHMAEWQSGVFYPLHILLPFLPLPIYWTLYQIVGIFFSGLFTYLYLRNLKISKLSSVFGGLTFSLSTFMFTWNAEVVVTPHSILWLPTMLLLIDKFLTNPKWRYWLLFISSGVASVLSGYWQTTFYVLGFSGLYVFLRALSISHVDNRTATKMICLLLFAYILIASLTAFHLLPTAELYARSSRPVVNLRADLQEILKGYLLKPQWLITYLVPDFFGHPTTRNNFSYSNGTYYEWALFAGTLQVIVLPFLFLLKDKGLKLLATSYLLLAILAASLSFDLPWSRWVYDAQVPVLSTGIANRILFIPAFVLAVVSAFSLHAWQQASEKIRRQITVITLIFWGLVFVCIWLFLFKTAPTMGFPELRFPVNWFNVSRRNTVIPTLVFLSGSFCLLTGAYKRKLLTVSIAVLAAGAVIQNLYQLHKFTPFTESKFIYPQHSTVKWLQQNADVNRYLGYNGVFMNYNFATQFGIYTIEGYDSLNDFRRTQLFVAAQKKGELTTDLSRSADVTLDSNFSNPDILRMLQLTGTKYLVDHSEYPDALDKKSKPVLPDDKQKLVFQDGDWKIYEYLDALPRAFLVGSYVVEPNDQAAVKKLFDPSIDLQQTVILSKEPQLKPEPDPTSNLEIISYTPNKIEFKYKSGKNQLLFLSDTYHPGWWTKIPNSQPNQVIPANFAFRAVTLPAGEGSVEMYYMPQSFTLGLKITLMGILLTLLIPRMIKIEGLS